MRELVIERDLIHTSCGDFEAVRIPYIPPKGANVLFNGWLCEVVDSDEDERWVETKPLVFLKKEARK